MILDDADHPAVERGVYVIGYCEMVDGYRHAWREDARPNRRGIKNGPWRPHVRYSRTANHPPDSRCPECHPPPEPTP